MYLIVPLALAPEYRVPAIGAWIILLLVSCMAVGAELGAGRDIASGPRTPREPSQSKRMLRLSLLLAVVGVLGAVYWTMKALGDNGLDFSIPGLLALGHLLSVDRYAGEQPPVIVRALVIWIYPAALLAGMSFAVARRHRERVLCFLPIAFSLLLSILQAAKANTLIAVALGLSGYLGMKVFIGGEAQKLIRRKSLLALGSAVTVVVLFFVTVDALRTHEQEQDIELQADWLRIKSASIGYLAVFSRWANSPDGPGSLHLGFGAYTFGGVLEVAGLHPRELGVYRESIELEGGDESNIYTAFRGLIEDFSFPGAAAFCFLAGFLSGRAYKNSSLGRETWTLGLAGFYVFLLWSALGSVFVYNGPLLAFFVGVVAFRSSRSSIRSEIPVRRLPRQPVGAV